MKINKKTTRIITGIFIISLFILPQIANASIIRDYNDYNKLTLDFKLEGKFDLKETGENPSAENVISYLSFFPQEANNQIIDSIDYYSNPNAVINEDGEDIVFTWNNPQERNFIFGTRSTVTINNIIVPIEEKIIFPLSNIENEYINPTEFIDLNEDIIAQAEEIANGEDDMYIVAFNVASWVHQNINYNLSTLTAEVVQKSSWVLERREGVCDELTNLFISMMRSLGIPARFVSGMAYTNTDDKWGAHGWAEIYFPDKGWVPFDVTYGQFGWVDPSHIKLKSNADSGNPAIRYTWKSLNLRLEGKKIDLNTSIKSLGEKISSPLQINIRPLINNVGPGSYVPIELEIINRNSFYMPDNFIVTKATNLTEKNFKSEILKPGETKKIFWVTKLPENLEEGYIYNSKIEIQDQFHEKTETEITAGKNMRFISLEEAMELIKENEKEIDKRIISKKISIKCDSPETILIGEADIDCKIKNKKDIIISDVNICYKDQCQNTSLFMQEEKQISFKIKNLGPGMQSLIITAETEGTRASDIVRIEVLENPEIKITNLKYPAAIGYNERLKISMTLTTKTKMNDVQVFVNGAKIIEIAEIKDTKEVVINANGKDLYGEEGLNIGISFKDIGGKEHTIIEHNELEIKNVPWYIKLLNLIGLI